MSSRQALDAKASSMMFILCGFWGLQQVVLKAAAADISPLMQLALRSGLSAVMVLPLLLLARNTQWASTEYLPAGVLVGILFAAEFFMLGLAIQYTSASHVGGFTIYRAYFCGFSTALETARRAFISLAMERDSVVFCWHSGDFFMA